MPPRSGLASPMAANERQSLLELSPDLGAPPADLVGSASECAPPWLRAASPKIAAGSASLVPAVSRKPQRPARSMRLQPLRPYRRASAAGSPAPRGEKEHSR